MIRQTTINLISKNKALLTEIELEDLRKMMLSRKNEDFRANSYLKTINFKERENDFYWQEHEKSKNIPHFSEFKSIKNAGIYDFKNF